MFQVRRDYLVCCFILHPPVRTCDTSDIINITGPLISVPPLGEPYVKLQRKHTILNFQACWYTFTWNYQ